MKREKDVFEIAEHLRQFSQKAEKELEDAVDHKEKEFQIEERVEDLLEEMETISEERLEEAREELGDRQLFEEWKSLLEEEKKAEKLLSEEELEELRDFLQDLHGVQQDVFTGLGYVPLEEAPDDLKELYWATLKAKSEVEKAINHRESEVELEGRTEKLLRMIESSDREEMREFQEKLGSEELRDKCGKIWEDVKKAREKLEEEEYGEVKEYVEDIREICRGIEEELDHVERLEEKYEIESRIGSGKNGTAYELVGYDDRILKVGDGTLKMQKRMKKLVDQVPDDVNIVRVIEVGLFQGKPASVIEKAPGQEVTLKGKRARNPEVWRKRMRRLAEAPQRHFDELLEDTETLLKCGLAPDGSVGNLFYSDQGFTWIDPLTENIVYRSEDGMDRERPWDYFQMVVGIPAEMPDSLSREDIRNVEKIAEKLEKAGAPKPEGSMKKRFREFLSDRGVEK